MARQRTNAPLPAQGLQILISAAAVTATLGGWAALTSPNAQALAPATTPAALRLEPAIPTLVPLAGAALDGATGAGAGAPALRAVSAPPARPAALTLTRSSR